MNKNQILIISGSIAITLLVGIGIGIGRFFFGSAPANEHSVDTSVMGENISEATEPTIWTCSMHPQIRQSKPGKCPICGMDLIPLKKGVDKDDGPRVMSMSEASRALAEIQTTVVEQKYPQAEIRLVGKLDYDETREKSLTARFPARIDELFVNFTGIRVEKGEHLAKVYSPDLLVAQRELLTAYRADPSSSITRAARDKLSLWDLLPEQIDTIIQSGEAKDNFVLKAPIGGVVVAKHVKEGNYLKTGEPLFRIVDLSMLWAYLDAYESDLPWLRYGQDVTFTVESFPGETFHGTIAFIEPEVNRTTRTVSIRVNVPNKEGRLKPGMFVRSVVESRLGKDGKVYAPDFAGKWISPMHPEIVKDGPGKCDICGMDLVPAEELGYVDDSQSQKSAPVVVPRSAVLWTGKRSVVYVEKPDSERPTYEGREIVLGPRAGDVYIVVAGLEAGERVVTNGAFKIDSALQIQAKPSMMNPEGGGPAPGHNHSEHVQKQTSSSDSQHQGTKKVEIPVDILPQLISPYLKMQAALSADDLEAAKDQAKAMMAITGHSGNLPRLLHDMLAKKTLDAFRLPEFQTLSDAFIEAVKKDTSKQVQDLIVMHCPMANNYDGADWLQASEPLRNPYFGATMLKCGEIVEHLDKQSD